MTYPIATPQPKTVTFGGIRYDDPYQWLEEDSPESLAWEAEQDRLTREWLEASAARGLAKSLIDAMPQLENNFPVYSGGRWFRKRTPEGLATQLLEVGETIHGPWRSVLDLHSFAEGRKLTIDVLSPSPDGRKVVVSFGIDGRELAEMRVFDVDSGAVLMGPLPQTYAFFPAWMPDSSGFYINARDPAQPAAGGTIYRHLLAQAPVTEPEAYESTADLMWVKAASDGRHMLLLSDHLNPRPDCIRDEAAGEAWRPFLKGESAQFRGDIIGDHFYAVTDDGAPCGRLVAIPLATPGDRATWKELLAGSADVLGTLLAVDGRLVLVDLVDTWSRMRVFDVEGRLLGEVPLPSRGSIAAHQFALFNMVDMFTAGASGDVVFPFSTPARSAALYRANIHSFEIEELTASQVNIDAQMHSFSTVSADGARVPYHVIARSDVDLSRPQPTAMYGYGGFQAALIPGWPGTYLAAWIQAGGVLVLMHLRGGGELGPEMWHRGRLLHKQNTFNDVHAIAQDVIARGISANDRLGVVGGSNGGLMAAAVVVQRPDLYRASLSQVPITDGLARVRDPITMSATLDYGDPSEPEMAQAIHAWSPYQNVKPGAAYPALLLDAGKQDVRCPPWHVRKLAASMQVATGGQHPILMRARDGTGHGASDVAGQRVQGIDWLTFLLDQLGLKP